MLSGQPLETNQNKLLANAAGEGIASRRLRVVIISLLAATGFIHWYLPVVHRMEMPGELTGGIVVIPHGLLHLLFDLNGVGYFVLLALVAGWLPLWANQPKRVYIVIAAYAALTIISWILLSDPTERGLLDVIDKGIELLIVVVAVYAIRRKKKEAWRR